MTIGHKRGDSMATNSSGKWSIDISDLKKNIADANKAIKSAQAELKNATAGMKKGEETVESLSRHRRRASKVKRKSFRH